MSKPFEFYFDFVSPYSFLAYKKIKLEKNYLYQIHANFKEVYCLHGIKAPAFIPSKAKFMIRDCKLIAEKDKILFKFNSYFPIKTLNLMRGVFIAKDDGFESFYIDKIFEAIWKDGLNMNDISIVEKILKNIDINPKTFLLRASSQTVKNLLKKRTEDAFGKGIFGAPSFYINNKVFWGQDRIEFALLEANK